ncbi:MAG TPA: TSUP family transporter, partial [Acetivibrio clariflavus]|nr:TSUP family transporter [Acetivibrio clariflavus]
MSKYIKLMLIGLVTGLANGLFGSGGGTIAVPAMILLLKKEDHIAHATA